MVELRRLADVEKLGQHSRPDEYEKKYGTDVLRYFEMRDIVYGLDVDFSDERLIERYNSDLANNLGNLASRVLRMAQRYCGGEVNCAAAIDGELEDATLGRRSPIVPGRRANRGPVV